MSSCPVVWEGPASQGQAHGQHFPHLGFGHRDWDLPPNQLLGRPHAHPRTSIRMNPDSAQGGGKQELRSTATSSSRGCRMFEGTSGRRGTHRHCWGWEGGRHSWALSSWPSLGLREQGLEGRGGSGELTETPGAQCCWGAAPQHGGGDRKRGHRNPGKGFFIAFGPRRSRSRLEDELCWVGFGRPV